MGAESSPKIAIVDESPIRAAILEEGLREAGYTDVVRIGEMQSLLSRIYALDPDVIVIDLENPSRDILEQMFQVSRAVRRPIAMFVDQSDAASIQASVDAGVSAYIVDGLKKERLKTSGRTGPHQIRARRPKGDRSGQGHPYETQRPDRGRGLRPAAIDRDAREEEDRGDRAVDPDGIGALEMKRPLHIGFIPLVDAAALILAVDKGFAAAEGLDVTLVREVSWSNIRDKLNIGLFDATHLLAPVAIASSLGLGHIEVPIVAPFNLGLNGNAITVSPALHAAIMAEIDGDRFDPMTTALALSRVVASRRKSGAAPLTFGMTFPFSTHNYQLRFWMAAGGIDPDEDVRLVVLPPPFMADSMASGQIDGFCVGAPWNSIAVDRGVGQILHFVSDILERAAEKVLALRLGWSERNPEAVAALVRAAQRAADFVESPQNRTEVAKILARPEYVGVDADLILRTLEGRLKISADGSVRESNRYLLVGREDASRPDPVQAAWLYGQMVRWGQAAMSLEALKTAKAVFRPDLYDTALGRDGKFIHASHAIGAFSGPAFNADDIPGHLAAFPIRRP
jgi:two-component system, oxyanion-binding sensor